MTSKVAQALNDILEKEIGPDDEDMVDERDGEGDDSIYVNNNLPSTEGMCSECGDQASSLACEQCEDDFCDVCFKAMHRKGVRKTHTTKRLREETKQGNNNNNNNDESSDSSSEEDEDMDKDNKEKEKEDEEEEDDDDDEETSEPSLKRPSISRFTTTSTSSATSAYDRYNLFSNYSSFGKANNNYYNRGNISSTPSYTQKPPPPPVEPKTPADKYIPPIKKDGPWFEDRAKYIPLRLTMEERKFLRLLEASLHVCDYTDKVDVPGLASSKAKRIVQQLKEICALLVGIKASTDFKSGKEMVSNRDFTEHAEFYQAVFEIGRRHKIMNPEKMRSEYGKLIYLLQDSMTTDIQDLIKFSMNSHSYLGSKGAVAMLHDPWMEIATREIIPDGKDRYDIQVEIKQKEKAIKLLSKKYVSDSINR